MGNKKNHVKKNKRLANNWRNIIKMRKGNIKKLPPLKEEVILSNGSNGIISSEMQYETTNSIESNESMQMDEERGAQKKLEVGCGMMNLGNTCFLNSVFQAFFHIPIVNLNLQKMELDNCSCIGCRIVTAFKDTHSQENQLPYDPSTLYRALQQDNRDILNGRQQDAHEFWLRMMTSMEKNCCEKLHKLFEHDFTSIVTCQNCNTKSTIHHKIYGHVIDVRGLPTIQESLNNYFTEKDLETFLCEVCSSNSAAQRFYLKGVPNCLHLVLNRFGNQNGLKIKDYIGLNDQLKVSKYNNDLTQETYYYKLVSIINHIGANRFRGHYTAVSCYANNYYEFDDSQVRDINIISGCNAYMLIYQLLTEIEVENNSETNEDNHNGLNREQFMSEINFEDTHTHVSTSSHIHGSQYNEEQTLNENEPIPTTYSHNMSENNYLNHQDEDEWESTSGNSSIQYEEEDRENKIPSGRRIVDFAFLFEQMKYLTKHSEECQSEMVFTKETKLGFRSNFHFQCSECGVFHTLKTSVNEGVTMSINKAATLGFTSIGSGFYHMEEVCAHLNIPCMSGTTFNDKNKNLQQDWWELARDQAELALKEEIAYAIATGSVDSAGNALIIVICDGSWGKRSYGKGFSSLSGCAAIIGLYTKKFLYYDVKNKYCHTCALSYAKTCPPNMHTCNISYEGPSSGMETEIIVEGFQSCELKGARFHLIISDGDSSAFKEISERCIYQNPYLIVEKLECVNHLHRNALNKFTSLCKDTDYEVKYRKLISPTLGNNSNNNS